jgi:non-homologous end joining protein Ku
MANRLALEFAGFPTNIELKSRVKKTRKPGFKNIAPSGFPAKQGKPVDEHTGKTFDGAKIRKGVEIGKGAYAIMTPEALDALKAVEKTEVAKPAGFAPLDTIALDLAIERYAVLPDSKVPGSGQGLNIIWNGLVETGLAYLAQVNLNGTMDGILVIYATDNGLWGAMLPFEHELYEIDHYGGFHRDEKAAKVFERVLKQKPDPAKGVIGYADRIGDFDHGSFESEYLTYRNEIIAKVVEGEDIEVPEQTSSEQAVDLMAFLETQVAA